MDSIRIFIHNTLIKAGGIVLDGFGSRGEEIRKENQSNVVTETDKTSEKYILESIRAAYPTDAIIAEESGTSGSSPICWVVDPLDGTSNFASNIPWFGILLARMENGQVTHAGMYLPMQDELFEAKFGEGTTLNGKKLVLAEGKELSDLLFGFQADYSTDASTHEKNIMRLSVIIAASRNVRMTNSCMDFSLFLQGSLGGIVGTCSKVWDIAAPSLLVKEAGGYMTDIDGNPLDFSKTSDIQTKNFTFLAGSHSTHDVVRKLLDSKP